MDKIFCGHLHYLSVGNLTHFRWVDTSGDVITIYYQLLGIFYTYTTTSSTTYTTTTNITITSLLCIM